MIRDIYRCCLVSDFVVCVSNEKLLRPALFPVSMMEPKAPLLEEDLPLSITFCQTNDTWDDWASPCICPEKAVDICLQWVAGMITATREC